MTRKLVAAYACRVTGTRLYGKPLQNLAVGYTILDHIIQGTLLAGPIDEVVLGIAEGSRNNVFREIAEEANIGFVTGSEKDVLSRLIACGHHAGATDVFRLTTECPFPAWEYLDEAWQAHLTQENDITVTDYLPEGCNFEIYRLSALERSHADGRDEERSEYCSAFARRRQDLFRIGLIEAKPIHRRLDLRLTVDYPEDLVLCREVYTELKEQSPRIPMDSIFAYLDSRPDLQALVERYVDQTPIWASCLK